MAQAVTGTEKVSSDDTSTPKKIHEIETGEPQVDMTGKVFEEESYCPASPAPVKPSPAFIYNSPVFTKNKSNPTRRQSMLI